MRLLIVFILLVSIFKDAEPTSIKPRFDTKVIKLDTSWLGTSGGNRGKPVAGNSGDPWPSTYGGKKPNKATVVDVPVKPVKPIKPIPDPQPGGLIIPRPVPMDFSFSKVFPAAAKMEKIPIKKILKDEKWREWLLNNPDVGKRPIYPPVYRQPTDIPPNVFTDRVKPTEPPYYVEETIKPETEKPYYPPEPTTEVPYQPPEPVTKEPEPYYPPEPITKRPRLPVVQPPKIPIDLNKRPDVYQVIKVLTLNRFLHLIDEAGLTHYLTGSGPVTVFVPSNEAFERLPYAYLEELSTNKESLKKFLLYHIVSGVSQTIGNIPGSYLQLTAASGHKLNINAHNKPKVISVNGVVVLQPDLGGHNGVFHIIKDALYPFLEQNLLQVLEHHKKFSTLLELVKIAGLADSHLVTGGTYTLFAPSNAAFNKLDATTLKWLKDNPKYLKQYLLNYFMSGTFYSFHMAEGDSFDSLVREFELDITKAGGHLYVKDKQIVQTDLSATNGVIHVVDDLIRDIKISDILQTLQNQGDSVSYFIEALKKAGLIDDHLTSGGPFTVFVPLTQAFKNLDQASLQWLLNNPLKLRNLMLNHFVKGVYYSQDLKNGQSLTSISGTELKITEKEFNGVYTKVVNGKRIVTGDIVASNGVIHIIDGTLFEFFIRNLLETLKIQNKFTVFISLFEKAGLDTLIRDGPYTVFAIPDDTLNKLDRKILIWLLKNPQQLKAFLLKYVVPGAHYTNSLTDGLQLYSLDKTVVKFSHKDNYINVNGKPIAESDIHAVNGVIHVINDLLFDITFQNLLETLKNQGGKFKIFLEALQNSGLIDDHLTSGGPFTVFVPTDDAFKKIDPVTLKWLLWDPVNLKALVLKHFVRNVYYYSDLKNGSSLTALGGQAKLLMAGDATGHKTVNGSPISNYDVIASNGVIHAIDDVLFSQGLKKPN